MKQKATTKSSAKLSRSAILRKYGITDHTLRLITERSNLFKLEGKAAHGRVTYDIGPDAHDILSMGRMCPHSFDGFRPPSFRYIALGVLTGDLEDVYYGLVDRGLACTRVDRAMIESIRDRLLSVFPAPLRKRLAEGKPPTAAQKKTFQNALSILGILIPYKHPKLVESFYFQEDRLTHFVNQVVWAHSCNDIGRSAILKEAAGCDVLTSEGVLWYRTMFHDDSYMRDKDLAFYYAGLVPSVRRFYQDAREMSVADLAMQSMMIGGDLPTLEFLARKVKERTIKSVASSNLEAYEDSRKDIKTFLTLADSTAKLRPNDTSREVPEYLRDVTVEEYDFDTTFQIPAEFKNDETAEKSG